MLKRYMIVSTLTLAYTLCANAQNVAVDSLKNDTLKCDTIKTDSVVVDSLAADSIAKAANQAKIAAAKKQKAIENGKKLKLVLSNIVDNGAITAKVKLNLVFGSQSQKVNATLRMKRNESIQLMLLAPFIGTELGRIEFTPDYMMVVDRFHGRYVQMAYSDVAFLKGANLDFYAVQALFWADLFAPGSKKASMADKFGIGNSNNQIFVKPFNTGKMVYNFYANPQTGTLSQTRITQTGTRYLLDCKYQAYNKLDGGKNFPTAVVLAFTGDQNMTLDMTLSSFGNNTNWDSRTTLSSKYEKLSSLEELFSGF